jgi:hypothetical protein
MERPVARTRGLVVKAVGDEVLVYDLERHRAHGLNRVAAALWRACDGTRPEVGLATHLREAEGIPVTPELVRYGLGELARARLVSGQREAAGLTRRELIRRLGTAAVAVPVVTSIVAPTPAQAQSSPCPGGSFEACSIACQTAQGVCLLNCVPVGPVCDVSCQLGRNACDANCVAACSG